METEDLFFEEKNKLDRFRYQLKNYNIKKKNLEQFSKEYEELIVQARVITRVSDRLQKKLDSANMKIQDQNKEIQNKNQQLESTVIQLFKAKVGRRASTLLLTLAIILFIIEQIYLEPIIEEKIHIPYLDYVILIVLFFSVKGLESSLANFFLNQKKIKFYVRIYENPNISHYNDRSTTKTG